jgi:hypothetical protein
MPGSWATSGAIGKYSHDRAAGGAEAANDEYRFCMVV